MGAVGYSTGLPVGVSRNGMARLSGGFPQAPPVLMLA